MINSAKMIKVTDGNLAVDDRGVIRFVNDFKFLKVTRFYHINNFSVDTIRAFHAHKKEAKYVYAVKGTFLLCTVRVTDFDKPSTKVKISRFVLSNKKPQVIYIPPGYANGYKALENDSSLIFFSTKTLKQSKEDDYRFPYDYWGKDIWKIKNR